MLHDLTHHKGSGSVVFPDPAATASGQIRLFTHVPARVNPGWSPFVALHGLDRNAEGFRDAFVDAAERLGRIVVVPEFDTQNFPTVYAYNYGNVVEPPPGFRVRPREVWAFSLLDRLTRGLGTLTGHDRCDLYGNSAGSQAVLRLLALTPARGVATAIASNSGVYLRLDRDAPYPTGLGGLGETDLTRVLSRRVHLLLGERDTDTAAPDLPTSAEAQAQGPHRLARGLWHHEQARALAARLGVAFGWTLEIVPSAGHVSQALFDRALAIRN